MDGPTNPADQATLVSALLDPAVYGPDVHRVEVLETHISHVFLAGPYAYKVKKAVDLGFLDFRSLDARYFYCREELRLNRRLAPALYVDVIAITGSASHPVLGGEGTPIEYAVRMHRFAQDELFDRLLANGRLTADHIDAVAEKIAHLHASAGVSSDSDPFGTAQAIQRRALENFAQIRSLSDPSFALPDLDRLQSWTERSGTALEDVFSQRKRAGFVRECHGDFHLGNVALVRGEVTIFDCIEFNEDLRWIDVMNEVAFFVMDLQEKRRPDLAQRFLNGYLEITGDYPGLRLLPFYAVYRAMVRAKVDCMRAHQAGLRAEQGAVLAAEYGKYVALAKAQTTDSRPAVLITHGLSGSGKTTLTRSLLEQIGAIRLRSDVERKRLHGLHPSTRTDSGLEEGLYSTDATSLTYARLLELTRTVAGAGYTAIVDATFLRRSQRDAFRHLAQTLGVPFVILDFPADEAVMRARITNRLIGERDASEADVSVLEHQLATQEPLQADELPWVVSYDAGTPRGSDDRPWRSFLDRLWLMLGGAAS
jgi:aminoglycoside phosphotransferase family enzyme/gluconate kinase